ncbi:patatin-like phospholipase family protein [Paracoccus sp. R86501]|uniref:patatin-like phospholipase family protein n=1 Tax=Paracoccus sp. R86501 TaxID=3101711 RepID=UPI003671B0AF
MTANATQITGRRRFLIGLSALALAGCNNAGPAQLSFRSTSDPDPLASVRLVANAGPETWARHAPVHRRNVLALSSGAEDGAFGAGALVGWSQTGKRPEFDIVTGVSTGALIAPFAFLGRSYDGNLQQIFTQYSAHDIMRLNLFNVAVSDALYNTTPLEKLIFNYTPPSFLKAIAKRHAEGAKLFIVTSELATSQAYVWDMGAIAQSGQYDLFRAILRASSAQPGLFPPVKLQYIRDGKTYEETHLDGGVHMQFLATSCYSDRVPANGHLYLLINNTLHPARTESAGSAIGILSQALTTMNRASALAAVNSTQSFADMNGIKLSAAAINPNAGIIYDSSDRFSQSYMNALFDHGFQRAVDGNLWVV